MKLISNIKNLNEDLGKSLFIELSSMEELKFVNDVYEMRDQILRIENFLYDYILDDDRMRN